MMFTKLFPLITLLPSSWAFYDTVPVVAWSSRESSLVETLNNQAANAHLDGLFRSGNSDVCDFDAVIVFEQPGLHATDLRSLSPSSFIPSRLKAARSSAQIPYVRRDDFADANTAISDVVEELSRRCGVRLQRSALDVSDIEEAEKDVKYVFHVTLSEVYGEGAWRRLRMSELEEELSNALTKVELRYPKHVVIYTGSLSDSSSSPLSRRQSLTDTAADEDRPFAFAPSNSTTEGGILARYQLLTPGLILSLAIAFFVLLPVVLLGIQALASIQSPVRLDAPKGVTQSKKNQ